MPIDRRQKGVTNMAARQNYSAGRQQYARRSSERNSASAQMYVYGNVVTKPAYEPRRHEKSPERPVKRTSRQVRRNRRQALHMSSAYVVFLTIAALMALIVCVNYVQLQSRITSRSKNITAMQEELASMREENTTRYNAVMDSVNLEEVRKTAQEKLGMVYAADAQIVEYQKPSSDYVKQYEKIPKEGVLAQSDKK